MSKKLVEINKESLEMMMGKSILSHSIEEIIEEPLDTREMMFAAGQSDLPDELKLLCDAENYLLFDNTLGKDEPLTVRVISKEYLDEVLKEVIKADEQHILNMVAVEHAHELLHIELFSTEYYEQFVTYVQQIILKGESTNWYVEMSDYIIDYLYDWFGENKMKEVAGAITRNQLHVKHDEAVKYLEGLTERYATADKIVKAIADGEIPFSHKEKVSEDTVLHVYGDQDVHLLVDGMGGVDAIVDPNGRHEQKFKKHLSDFEIKDETKTLDEKKYIRVEVNKLSDFTQKEREILVLNADLVSQCDIERKIILYPTTIYSIFKLWEEEKEDSEVPESLAKYCEDIHDEEVDQYIFD